MTNSVGKPKSKNDIIYTRFQPSDYQQIDIIVQATNLNYSTVVRFLTKRSLRENLSTLIEELKIIS